MRSVNLPLASVTKSARPAARIRRAALASSLCCGLGLALGACGAADAAPDPAAGELGDEGTGRLSQPIVGGETDREHIAVLAIATITPDVEALCTGTLIAPNLVLTARHCVVPVESEVVDCSSSRFPEPFEPDALWVSPSTTLRGANLFPVREVAVPEDDGALCGADIALLILDGQFSDAVAPIAPRLDLPAARGEAFTAVGFGSALDEGGAGIRRAVSGIEVVCGADQCGAPSVLTSTEFVSEQAVCQGDSGGPALDEDGRVLGVASRTGEECTWAIYSAVLPWRDWIIGVAERAVSFGDYDAPEWLTGAGAAPGDVALGEDDPGEDDPGATGSAIPDLGDAVVEAPRGAPLDGAGDDADLDGTVSSASSSDSGCALGAMPTGHASRSAGASLGLGMLALALGRRRRSRAG